MNILLSSPKIASLHVVKYELSDEECELWYRCEPSRYLCEPPRTDRRQIDCYGFQVIRKTPKGVRVHDYSLKGRFILYDAVKQWASPTPEKALIAFIARKKRQVEILKEQLAQAEEALEIANEIQADKEEPK